MVLDGPYVYYVDGTACIVAKTAIEGKDRRKPSARTFGLVKPPFNSRYGQNPSSMAIDPAYSTIYVTNYDGVTGRCNRSARMGGAVTTLAPSTIRRPSPPTTTYVHWRAGQLAIRNAAVGRAAP